MAATVATIMLSPVTPSALADFDLTYCLNWHSPNHWCTGNYGDHSYNYNRIETGNATYLCQRLRTPAGNNRSGWGCTDAQYYLHSHQYNGGTPLTIAACLHHFPPGTFMDCLASTP